MVALHLNNVQSQISDRSHYSVSQSILTFSFRWISAKNNATTTLLGIEQKCSFCSHPRYQRSLKNQRRLHKTQFLRKLYIYLQLSSNCDNKMNGISKLKTSCIIQFRVTISRIVIACKYRVGHFAITYPSALTRHLLCRGSCNLNFHTIMTTGLLKLRSHIHLRLVIDLWSRLFHRWCDRELFPAKSSVKQSTIQPCRPQHVTITRKPIASWCQPLSCPSVSMSQEDEICRY